MPLWWEVTVLRVADNAVVTNGTNMTLEADSNDGQVVVRVDSTGPFASFDEWSKARPKKAKAAQDTKTALEVPKETGEHPFGFGFTVKDVIAGDGITLPTWKQVSLCCGGLVFGSWT